MSTISNNQNNHRCTSNSTIACIHCDLLINSVAVNNKEQAICPRCNHTLYSSPPCIHSNIAWVITGLLFYFPTILLPFLQLETSGQTQTISLLSSVFVIGHNEMILLAITVALLVIIFPLIKLLGLLSILIPLSKGQPPLLRINFTRWIINSAPWNMIEVYLVGVLVTLVKLTAIADVSFSVGFYTFVLFIIVNGIISFGLPKIRIWQTISEITQSQLDTRVKSQSNINDNTSNTNNTSKTALQNGYYSCLNCSQLVDQNITVCPTCHSRIEARKKDSLTKTTAFLLTAIILLFPANLLPTMTTTAIIGSQDDTIISGIIHLWANNDKPIAIIVFIASFITPLFKLISISYLCISCYFRSNKHIMFRMKLYHFNELIGRWSMIDVFVVALLGALVQMGSLATIQPRIGIVAFALVVFFSMVSLQHFDPRLIWDNTDTTRQEITE